MRADRMTPQDGRRQLDELAAGLRAGIACSDRKNGARQRAGPRLSLIIASDRRWLRGPSFHPELQLANPAFLWRKGVPRAGCRTPGKIGVPPEGLG
jgi:hypothetical protein